MRAGEGKGKAESHRGRFTRFRFLILPILVVFDYRRSIQGSSRETNPAILRFSGVSCWPLLRTRFVRFGDSVVESVCRLVCRPD